VPDQSARPALGGLVAIDDRTVLVLGQELDVTHEQRDVSHALVHRADGLALLPAAAAMVGWKLRGRDR